MAMAGVAMAGVAGAACVASACVASACVAAAGERACQRCASASAGRGAVRQQQCAEGDVQHRLTVGLHAFMLVLRAMNQRGMWLSGCALGGGDVAGVSRMRAAMPRAGETHSSLHAQHAGSSRVRARRSAAGVRRQAHRDLGRHHHATIMTWAGWTRHVTAARAAISLAATDAHLLPSRRRSACQFERFESTSKKVRALFSRSKLQTRDQKSKNRPRAAVAFHALSAARAAVTCRVHPAQVMIVA